MIRFYCIGLSVLLFAIAANGMATSLGLKTWYGFLDLLLNRKEAMAGVTFFDGFWLFFAYPLILGGSAILGDWIYQQITHL